MSAFLGKTYKLVNFALVTELCKNIPPKFWESPSKCSAVQPKIALWRNISTKPCKKPGPNVFTLLCVYLTTYPKMFSALKPLHWVNSTESIHRTFITVQRHKKQRREESSARGESDLLCTSLFFLRRTDAADGPQLKPHWRPRERGRDRNLDSPPFNPQLPKPNQWFKEKDKKNCDNSDGMCNFEITSHLGIKPIA